MLVQLVYVGLPRRLLFYMRYRTPGVIGPARVQLIVVATSGRLPCALCLAYALLCHAMPCTADRVQLQCWQPSSIVLQRPVLTYAMLDCADDQQQIVTASLDKSVALWSATVSIQSLTCPTPSALTGESHRACAALPRPLHTDDVARHCPACIAARRYAGISMKQLASAAQAYFCNYLWQIFFCHQLCDIDCVFTTYSGHIEALEITSAHASAR